MKVRKHKLYKINSAWQNTLRTKKKSYKRKLVSLLCLFLVIVLGMSAIMSYSALSSNDIITWGDVQGVESTDADGVRTWDISKTTRRYVDIPVTINISDMGSMSITFPQYLSENLRNQDLHAEINTAGVIGEDWTVTKKDGNVVINYNRLDSAGGQHGSIVVFYRFDCWNVKSGTPFTIPYTIVKGEENENTAKGELKGKIITGHDVDFDNYFFSWGDSAYSLSALGGADKATAYIPKWSEAYDKYFDLKKEDFENEENKDKYLYDVAPFLVKPKGQQPYDISGTLTLDQGGDILGAVYMMDSAKGSNAPWIKVKCNENEERVSDDESKKCNFSIENQQKFETSKNDKKLIDFAVTGDLTDPVDSKNYTLYFLVRYPKESLKNLKENNQDNNGVKVVKLEATLSLTHNGVDSKEEKPVQKEQKQILYQGQLVETRIYWASYVNNAVVNRKALTALGKGIPVNLDFAADFFCLNEARKTFNSSNPEKYTLKAIIDLSYLTTGLKNGELQNAQQLDTQDYRFHAFNISLVDAPGSWSQDWTYQETDQNGGWLGTPNVGWTEETWGKPPIGKEYSVIKVYGSTSLDGDTWEEIKTIKVEDVWAQNQDRGFATDEQGLSKEFTIDDNKNYVRLKVEYDSQWTTALRVGYQIELLPGLLENHKEKWKEEETQELTCWFNYMVYKDSEADTNDMKFQRYPVSDGGWDKNTAGTIEAARKYDKKLAETTKFNDSDNIADEKYSMRNFAKATLSTFEESAGMLITQALYDSSGTLVGDPNSISWDETSKSDSYSLKDSVINVSEIVFNISGAITDGSSNTQELEAYRKWLSEQSEEKKFSIKNKIYHSKKMRYYVLLPQGMKLNMDPDEGHEKDEEGNPYYHFWTKGTDEYLSASSSFYNNNSSKVVQMGETDVPVSASNISGWERKSANGNLSEMWWVAGNGDKVKVVQDSGDRQLVIFERTLTDKTAGERFNMWGTSEVYFYGRGLSFSAVPVNGTGSLPFGDYTTHVWCQYLDEQDNPIEFTDLKRDEADRKNDLLQEKGIEMQKENTLLHIAINFSNKSSSGSSTASIRLESDNLDSYGVPIVDFEQDYKYRLDYKVTEKNSNDVVLWTNIEKKTEDNLQYSGTLTGITLPENIKEKVKVYVRTDWFNEEEYLNSQADKNWLTNEKSDGWSEVTDIDNYQKWSEVKAIAFSFEEQFTTNNKEINNSVSVYINMKAPKSDDLLKQKLMKENTYSAVSRLIFSDSFPNGEENKKACTPANFVPVSISIRLFEIPEAGGHGVMALKIIGLVLCLIGCYMVWLVTKHKKHANR